MKLPKGAKDLTGQRFGSLVAEEPVGVKHKIGVVWRCKCDCGNYRDVVATQLLQNQSKVRACLQCAKKKTTSYLIPGNNFKDLTGKRFGMLTVLERDASKNKTYWLCQCDCGSPPKSICGSHLTSGKITSCGCTKRERMSSKLKQPPREIVDCGGYMYFESKGHKVLFDPEDIDVATMCLWTVDSLGYCCGAPEAMKDTRIRFHRAILSKYQNIDGMEIDHRNGNRDDCRKVNLRVVTHSQNMKNLCDEPRGNRLHKGVHQTKSNKWRAKIQCDNTVYTLGTFDDFQDACTARDAAEVKLFGEFSRLMAPPPPED